MWFSNIQKIGGEVSRTADKSNWFGSDIDNASEDIEREAELWSDLSWLHYEDDFSAIVPKSRRPIKSVGERR
jgi:hypothetical protein